VTEIVYKELSFAVVGAAMEVHRHLGPGFLESVYQAALVQELTARGMRIEQHKRLPVCYKGVPVGEFEADVLVENKIILELKAVDMLHPKHAAQARNYLAATGLDLAIVLNFGSDSMQQQRVVRQRNNSPNSSKFVEFAAERL
jgi:GxxExxY protein